MSPLIRSSPVRSSALALAALALAAGATAGCGPNPYEARIEGVLLADADNVAAPGTGPLVKLTATGAEPELLAGAVRLAVERTVPWSRVAAALQRAAAAGATPTILVGNRDQVHGFVLSDDVTGPAIQVTSTPDGKFCVGPPTSELAKCVQSSDKRHVNRAFVREIIRDAVKAYDLTDVEVHVTPDLEWADVVRTIDGARTCCGKTVPRVKLADG
ncbi:MAG: hypothetical protein H6708_12450 [Kofleriaceae bacterium]|nr:hypothetical protein [Myxococcales bacterium]MCB9561210.1 hypothetical protein [Kofleriaceae bacterium]